MKEWGQDETGEDGDRTLEQEVSKFDLDSTGAIVHDIRFNNQMWMHKGSEGFLNGGWGVL